MVPALTKKINEHGGFTLVELMVVVAIIGLLSAVAIPNFKKYQAKSKISEAKLQLSAAYTAEQSFFSDFNFYYNCLPYMGFDPGPEFSNRYYAIGIHQGSLISSSAPSAYASAVNSGLDSSFADGCPIDNNTHMGSTSSGVKSLNRATWFPAGKGVGSTIADDPSYIADSGLGDQSSTIDMTFTIVAGGVISGDFTTSTTSSRLQITQDKILLNSRSGY
jgi:type IV pilus assembly protein PilA